jgi:ABC-type phosphate/phosphonate transport system substrate-binding protein
MAAIAVGLLALCCCSSSASAGSYMGGLVSGTEPHFLKTIEAPLMKELVEEVEKLTQEKDDIEKTMDPTDQEMKKRRKNF